MPNLIRAPSMPSVPSIPCLASPINPPSHGPSSLPTMPSLRSSQSFDSSSGLARLHSSSKMLVLMSVINLPKERSLLCIDECVAQLSVGNLKCTGCSLMLVLNNIHLVSCRVLVPSPGQLSQRVQSVGNFPTAPRHPLKATAYVSPTVQQGPTSTSLSTSTSLNSISSSAALPQPLKPSSSSSFLPQALKPTSTNQLAAPRSSLPRPASFMGTSGVPRPSKITQPTRR